MRDARCERVVLAASVRVRVRSRRVRRAAPCAARQSLTRQNAFERAKTSRVLARDAVARDDMRTARVTVALARVAVVRARRHRRR